MRVCVVHDWLTLYGGAERVLAEILSLFPKADLFAVVDYLSETDRHHLGGKKARTTFIQKLPFARTLYPNYLPLMPLAIEQLDLSGYDLVISSSSAVAKGVIIHPDQRHICYCYSPMRYAWDLQEQYLKGKKKWLTRYLLHKMRLWDVSTSHSVDTFLTLSHFVARRIEKCYRREAQVIYPPVDVFDCTFQEKKEPFYVTASRLVPYKRIDCLVEAFRAMPGKTLFVIGEGPERKKLEKRAPPNVTFLGHLPRAELKSYLARASAFLYAAIEDFGIAPLEAQASGTPVIAYKKGGVVETLGLGGVFYEKQTAASICDAVDGYEKGVPIDPEVCRENALRFEPGRFRDQLMRSF